MEDGTVMPARLLGESEQREKEQSRARVNPPSHLHRCTKGGITPPDERGHDLDKAEVVVSVRPRDPWREFDPICIDENAVSRDRNCETHLEAGKQHESEVTPHREGAVVSQHLVELGAANPECAQGQD